jgi:hypothetical protein
VIALADRAKGRASPGILLHTIVIDYLHQFSTFDGDPSVTESRQQFLCWLDDPQEGVDYRLHEKTNHGEISARNLPGERRQSRSNVSEGFSAQCFATRLSTSATLLIVIC